MLVVELVACLKGSSEQAILIGATSFCAEIEQNIPEVLYERLEKGEYGYDYLKELDTRLIVQEI